MALSLHDLSCLDTVSGDYKSLPVFSYSDLNSSCCNSVHLQIKYSHLDIAGRPVVVLEKNNVVPDHNQHVQVI